MMQYLRGPAVSLLVIASMLCGGGASAQTPSTPAPSAPSGSSPTVVRLQTFQTIVAFLNLAAGTVRIVTVLDPSAEYCDQTIDAVESILSANPSKRLRAYVVWSALTKEDTEMRALSLSNRVRDHRLVYFWDPGALVAGSFRNVVGSGVLPATGIVLLYDTDAYLALDPPAPSAWMSANSDIKGPALDAKQLAAETNAMVQRVEQKINDGAAPKQ